MQARDAGTYDAVRLMQPLRRGVVLPAGAEAGGLLVGGGDGCKSADVLAGDDLRGRRPCTWRPAWPADERRRARLA